MTITAWYFDNIEGDQRLPHRCEPNQEVDLSVIESLGILSWQGLTGVNDPILAQVRKERGYNYHDICNVCPEKLPGYELKIKSFFEEHIHYDEEIRYCLEGSGYFDIRDFNNKWIRIELGAGDMIILPEGGYHRFTCDSNNYIQAMRLFVGEPVWTPYNRTDIDELKNESRLKYVNKFLK
jgi:1,2-dihydroxy-3-keto-5-methylthiopentene dioxygenase